MRPDIDFYSKIESNVATFAQTRQDIRAAFVIGSRARSDHPADEWSDMDIVLYTTAPDFYLGTQDWLLEIGDLLTTFVSNTAGGDPERLNLFAGGYQVDFVIHHADAFYHMVQNKLIPDNFHRGVRVLLDRDNCAAAIMPERFTKPESTPCSKESFAQVTNMFWFSVLYIAKQICRGDLWVAKMRDNDSKMLLLQMIEWSEKCVHGDSYDTWHAGRFMDGWINANTRKALTNTFSDFTVSDTWQALIKTMDLFTNLAASVAQHKGFALPQKLETTVRDWINTHKK